MTTDSDRQIETSLRFDCVFYYVSDLDQSVNFYNKVLGLTLVSHDVVARFDLDGVLVELIPATDQSQMAGGGNARICLVVADIHEAARSLEQRGATVGGIEVVDNGRLATFQDPDGNELVLWQYE